MASICNSTYVDKPIVINPCYDEEIRLLANNIITETTSARKIDPTKWLYDYNAN